jgi:hypothetical protein
MKRQEETERKEQNEVARCGERIMLTARELEQN